MRKFQASSIAVAPTQYSHGARPTQGTRLHSGTRSRMLSAIGATERAYSRPTSFMTETSRNASEVPLPGTALCWRKLMLLASNFLERYIDTNSCLWHHSSIKYVHFEPYFYGKICTSNRKITKYWQINIWCKVTWHCRFVIISAIKESCDWFIANYNTARKWLCDDRLNQFASVKEYPTEYKDSILEEIYYT